MFWLDQIDTAFMGVYTQSLFWPAVVGGIAFVGRLHWGVDKNPFALPYSIYIMLWSVQAISSWFRRESELKFMWGTELFEETEKPRRPFLLNPSNPVKFNPFRQAWEKDYKSKMGRFSKILVSGLVLMAFVAGVVFTSYTAMYVKLLIYKTTHTWFLITVAIREPQLIDENGDGVNEFVEVETGERM
eukprot:SAG31_NODE_8465_length_1446_cov_1.196733_1_plen_186_part_10